MEKIVKTPKTINLPKDRVGTLKIYSHYDIPVYIMQHDGSIFSYFFAYNKEIYTSWIEMFPEKGKIALTPDQLKIVIGLVCAGAETSIEAILGIKPDEAQQALAETVIKAGDKVFGKEK